MTNEEATQAPEDLSDTASLKIVLEQLEAYRKVTESNAATMIGIAESQAKNMERIADAFDRIAKACETNAGVMLRIANGMEHSIEQQFHAVRG